MAAPPLVGFLRGKLRGPERHAPGADQKDRMPNLHCYLRRPGRTANVPCDHPTEFGNQRSALPTTVSMAPDASFGDRTRRDGGEPILRTRSLPRPSPGPPSGSRGIDEIHLRPPPPTRFGAKGACASECRRTTRDVEAFWLRPSLSRLPQHRRQHRVGLEGPKPLRLPPLAVALSVRPHHVVRTSKLRSSRNAVNGLFFAIVTLLCKTANSLRTFWIGRSDDEGFDAIQGISSTGRSGWRPSRSRTGAWQLRSAQRFPLHYARNTAPLLGLRDTCLATCSAPMRFERSARKSLRCNGSRISAAGVVGAVHDPAHMSLEALARNGAVGSEPTRRLLVFSGAVLRLDSVAWRLPPPRPSAPS